jgi:hypothetical protein
MRWPAAAGGYYTVVRCGRRCQPLAAACQPVAVLAYCSIAVACNESECLTDRSGEMSF